MPALQARGVSLPRAPFREGPRRLRGSGRPNEEVAASSSPTDAQSAHRRLKPLVKRSPFPNQNHRQVTGTSSVRYRWSTRVSASFIRTPPRCICSPVHAIIAPLSMHRSPGGTNMTAPRSEAIRATIACNRPLRATPPPSRTSWLSKWAIARSVTSVSIANATSWIENAMSSIVAPCFRSTRAAVSIPLNATSIPFTLYGRDRSVFPSRASFSRIGPPGKGRPHSRANLSSMLPTPVERLPEHAIPPAGEGDDLGVPSAHVQENRVLRLGDAAAYLEVRDAVVDSQDRDVEGKREGSPRGRDSPEARPQPRSLRERDDVDLGEVDSGQVRRFADQRDHRLHVVVRRLTWMDAPFLGSHHIIDVREDAALLVHDAHADRVGGPFDAEGEHSAS